MVRQSLGTHRPDREIQKGPTVAKVRGATCPRCGQAPSDPKGRLLALSRLDNQTDVCEACGTDEALIDAGRQPVGTRPLTEEWKEKMKGGGA